MAFILYSLSALEKKKKDFPKKFYDLSIQNKKIPFKISNDQRKYFEKIEIFNGHFWDSETVALVTQSIIR